METKVLYYVKGRKKSCLLLASKLHRSAESCVGVGILAGGVERRAPETRLVAVEVHNRPNY